MFVEYSVDESPFLFGASNDVIDYESLLFNKDIEFYLSRVSLIHFNNTEQDNMEQDNA